MRSRTTAAMETATFQPPTTLRPLRRPRPPRSTPLPPRCSHTPIKIFDTTLRDGLRFPLTVRQSVELATQLALLRVDVIEAGFPCCSPHQRAVTAAVARLHAAARPVVAALVKPAPHDIDICFQALRRASFPRLHVYLPTPRRVTKGVTRSLLKTTEGAVAHARALCQDVQFSPMHAVSLFKTDKSFLRDIYSTAILAGASTISIPDTTAIATPDLYENLVQYLKQTVERIDTATISVHAHGTPESSLRNSLAALEAGARQVECTVRGVGDAMTPLEHFLSEVKRVNRERGDVWSVGVADQEIENTSQLVAELMHLHTGPSQP